MTIEERHEIYANGQLVSVTDTRTLAGEKARRIAAIKEQAGEAILAAYPAYKQQNAALGIYSAEEIAAIKAGIQTIRGECDTRETVINACNTLAELDNTFDTEF
jgi:hypothetical protein